MNADLTIQILSLILAAGIPTITFIFTFGRLTNRVDNFEKDVARLEGRMDRIETRIDKMENKLDQVLFYLMNGNKAQTYPPIDKKD